jgi:glycosyltransferase involved in cell wall biosynthesis
MPQVTVIIATYNRSRLLGCALASLLGQTHSDFEAWIVGDACTDESAQVVASFGDTRLHWTNLAARVGHQSGPNNEGLRRAAAPLVAYLGHDDLWFPWHLQTLTEVVAREGADFAYGGVVFVGPEGPREAYGDTKVTAQVSVAPPSGWLHRRAIADRCGPWREPSEEVTGIDVGFQARAFLAGFRFAGSRNMSVLKFPSPWWQTYARETDLPQETYLARLRTDARQLHGAVLSELVLAYARRCDEASVTVGLKSAFRGAQRYFGERYGVDRWPLRPYLRWRHMHRRRRALARRGLPQT